MVGFSLTGLVDNFVNWLPFAGPALFAAIGLLLPEKARLVYMGLWPIGQGLLLYFCLPQVSAGGNWLAFFWYGLGYLFLIVYYFAYLLQCAALWARENAKARAAAANAPTE